MKPNKYEEVKKNLLNISTPEYAYILGLLWADGYVYKNPKQRNYEVGIQLINTDFLEITPILKKIGKWNLSTRDRSKDKIRNYKFSGIARIYSEEIVDILTKYDFNIKSGTSPNKILSAIPNNLKHYWWRGYFDGDGCIMKYRLTITSTFEQDWLFFKELCYKLEINFNILKVKTNVGHRFSYVYLSKMRDRAKFLNYIYKGEKLGLSRKFNKANEFLNIFNKVSKSKEDRYIYKHKNGYIFSIDRPKLKIKEQRMFPEKHLAIEYRDSFLKTKNINIADFQFHN